MKLVTRTRLLHYAIAAGACGLALLLSLALDPFIDLRPTPLFTGAIVVSAWAGGLGPGLAASLASLLILDFFFFEPHGSLGLTDLDGTLQLMPFAVVALVISWLNAARRTAQYRAEAAGRRMAYLAEVSAQLAGPLDIDAILQRVARLAVPTLADWAFVAVVQPDGRLGRLTVAQASPAGAPLAETLRRLPSHAAQPTGLDKVVRTGRAELANEVDDRRLATIARTPEQLAALRAIGIRSWMIVPLEAHARVLAVLLLAGAESGRRYTPDDLALAEEVTHRAALALENALLYREAQRALAREQAVRIQAEQLATERAAILHQITDGVIIANPDGRCTFLNEAATRLVGDLEPGVAITHLGKMVAVLTMAGEPYSPGAFPLARACFEGETVVDLPMRLRQSDGREIVVRGSATPVAAENGRRLGAVLTLHDVTAQHELERAKDEFFANISHDLRTPVTGVKASIEVVLTNLPPDLPPPLHRLLVNIGVTAERMARLVDDLLELTRLQAGRTQTRRRGCDLRDLVTRAARTIEALAQTRQQRVSVESIDAPVCVLADVDRLERALLNLLSNAQKYGRVGGCIRVTLTTAGSEAIVRVADDGPGIPLPEQERIFERFYRIADASMDAKRGSGLGLAIARATVDLHGGRIWVESMPGAGATFAITLPLADPSMTELERENDEDPGDG